MASEISPARVTGHNKSDWSSVSLDQLRPLRPTESFFTDTTTTQSTALHVAILPLDPQVGRVTRGLFLVAHSASSVLEEVTVSDE